MAIEQKALLLKQGVWTGSPNRQPKQGIEQQVWIRSQFLGNTGTRKQEGTCSPCAWSAVAPGHSAQPGGPPAA